MQIADNSNTLIEEANEKYFFKHYDCKYFSDIQEIGSGTFGKVYRAKWKSSEQYLALKTFSVLDNVTAKEIVHEIKLQREVDFHNNVIRFYGITKSESENPHNSLTQYSLVMEYADSGTFRDYLKKNFCNLTWNGKLNLAYQLVCTVSWLHNERIIHGDLNPSSILVHQNTIKLADFGLSKRMEEASKQRSRLFSIFPYMDPKRLTIQKYELDEKSDVYSVGVLLWEISSGRPPFHNEGETYDVGLIHEITQGARETPVPGTPDSYVKLYTGCWDRKPKNRPTINEVVEKLKEIMSPTKNNQSDNLNAQRRFNSNTNEFSLKLKNIIQKDFSSSTIKGGDSIESFNGQELLFAKPLKIMVDEMANLVYKKNVSKEYIIENYCRNHNVSTQEVYNWLMNNQDSSNSIFLLGRFNYLGIVTSINKQKAFELYQRAADLGNNAAQFNLGLMYKNGEIVEKDCDKASELFKKSIEGYSNAINSLGMGGCSNSRNVLEECSNAIDTLGGNFGFSNSDKAELHKGVARFGAKIGNTNLEEIVERGGGILKEISSLLQNIK